MQKIIATVRGSFKSFTMWFNGVMASVLAAFPVLHDSLPQLSDYLTQDIYKKLMAVTIVGNIILRVKTNKALHEK